MDNVHRLVPPLGALSNLVIRAIELTGQLVRQGMDPEAAGVQAVRQAGREKALAEVGAGEEAKRGLIPSGLRGLFLRRDRSPRQPEPGPYTGPTPWRR